MWALLSISTPPSVIPLADGQNLSLQLHKSQTCVWRFSRRQRSTGSHLTSRPSAGFEITWSCWICCDSCAAAAGWKHFIQLSADYQNAHVVNLYIKKTFLEETDAEVLRCWNKDFRRFQVYVEAPNQVELRADEITNCSELHVLWAAEVFAALADQIHTSTCSRWIIQPSKNMNINRMQSSANGLILQSDPEFVQKYPANNQVCHTVKHL